MTLTEKDWENEIYPLENRLSVLYSLTTEAEELGMDEATASGWRWIISELLATVGEYTPKYRAKN